MNIINLLSVPEWIENSKLIAVAITDMEGNYTYINRHFNDLFSWLKDDLIGKPSALTIHPDDMEKCQKAVEECILNPDSFVSVEIRKPIGNPDNYEWTEWEFSLMKGLDGEPLGILCLGYDITNIKHLGRELVKKDDLIFKMNQVQSHDVRGPVASMKGLVDLIISNDGQDIELLKKYSTHLKESLDKLDSVIQRVVKMGEKEKSEELL